MAIDVDTPLVLSEPVAFGPTVQLGASVFDVPLVDRAPVVYGGTLVTASALAAAEVGYDTPELAMSLWDDDNATLIDADVTRVRGSLSFLDDPLSVGVGSVEVLAGSTDEVTAADTLSFGRIGRISFRDQPAAPVRILGPDTTVEQSRDHGDLRRKIRLADLRSLFEEVKVQPRNGPGARPTGEQRTVSWASPEYDDSGWLPAVERQIVVSYSWVVPNTDPPWFTPWLPPDGWPVSETPVISTTTTRTHAADRGLLRRTYTVPSDGWYQVWCAAWWKGIVYLDGYKIGEGNDFPADMWQEPFLTEPFYLTAGEHVFGVELSKPALPDVSWAPGTLGTINSEMSMAFNLHRLDDGANTIIGNSTVVMKSDRDWKRLHAPAVDPAPTFGRWFWIFCTEAIARNALPSLLTRTFSDTHDSNGVPWPNTGPATVRTSDTYEQVVQQMQELGYRVRFGYSGLTLNAYAPDSAGTSTGVTVPTVRRERTQRRPRTNRLLVSYRDGQFEVEDAAAITAAGKAIEDELQVADMEYQRAYDYAQGQLARFALEQQSVQVEVNMALSEADAAPYTAYRPLDRVNIAAAEGVEVARIRIAEDRAGKAKLTPDLYAAPESAERRLSSMLQRGIPGTINGGAQTSTPTRWLRSGISGGFAVRYNIAPFSTTGEPVTYSPGPPPVGRSTPETFDRPVRLTRIKLGSVGTVTSTVYVSLMKNNAAVDSLFLLPGIYNTEWLAMHHYYSAGDELWFRVDDAGAGAYLLRAAVVAVPASPAQVKPTGRLPWD